MATITTPELSLAWCCQKIGKRKKHSLFQQAGGPKSEAPSTFASRSRLQYLLTAEAYTRSTFKRGRPLQTPSQRTPYGYHNIPCKNQIAKTKNWMLPADCFFGISEFLAALSTELG